MKPWYGFDLDGTLAEYNGWQGAHHIGAPIPATLSRLKQRLADGHEVRIFTARIAPADFELPPEEFDRRSEEVKIATYEIKKWCFRYVGKVLPITYQKDYGMVDLEDDRVTQIEPNTGRKAVDVAFDAGYQKGLLDGAEAAKLPDIGPSEEHGITS
jgi:hypothetical protein